MGAQMVREVASKTSDVAGDGTTTATVLAQAIYRDGVKTVAAGASAGVAILGAHADSGRALEDRKIRPLVNAPAASFLTNYEFCT